MPFAKDEHAEEDAADDIDEGMSRIAKVISAVRSAGLSPLLQQQGFRNRDTNYYRTAGEILQVVTVQSSQWNHGNSGRFRVNFGVHFGVVAASVGLPDMPLIPKEHYCILRGIWSVPERWWNVDSTTNIGAVSGELAVYARELVWPWLRRHESLEEAAVTFEQQPGGMGLWFAAAARLHLGQRDQAQRLVNACIALSEASLSSAHPENVLTYNAQLQRIRQWADENNLTPR